MCVVFCLSVVMEEEAGVTEEAEGKIATPLLPLPSAAFQGELNTYDLQTTLI
jgi:hypothetical protein